MTGERSHPSLPSLAAMPTLKMPVGVNNWVLVGLSAPFLLGPSLTLAFLSFAPGGNPVSDAVKVVTIGIGFILAATTSLGLLALRGMEMEHVAAWHVKLERAQQELVNALAHEFRNPLTSIDLQVYVLGQFLRPRAPGRIMAGFGILERNSKRVNELVERLFDVVRLELAVVSSSRAR